jgi:hypothetical protein
MNVTKQHLSQSYKTCAAKGCSRPGIHGMEILFLGRKGWFCEQCKDSLMRDGLLLQHQGVDNIPNDSHDDAIRGRGGDGSSSSSSSHNNENEDHE